MYCANEETEQGPRNRHAAVIHHVDTVTEVLKEMIRETRTDISEISKQVGRSNGPRTQASSEIMAQMRRQSSFSSQGDPGDLLKVESLSTLKKKKKRKTSDNLERSTSEPTAEGQQRRRVPNLRKRSKY